jgi:hypothetical protein
MNNKAELLGKTLTLREAAELFGYGCTRSLGHARRTGSLAMIEGIHWRKVGVNRILYFSGPCQHMRDHGWAVHKEWLRENFPDVFQGDAVPIAS